MQNSIEMRLAVLIDADNVPHDKIDGMMKEIARYGTPTIKRIYGDWTKPDLKGWKNLLLSNAITPIQQYRYTVGKNATDSAMIIEAMDMLYAGYVDGFFIVSSDSDFTRLALRLRESGKRVYGMGERKTPRPFIVACDKFTYIEIIDMPAGANIKSTERDTISGGSNPRKRMVRTSSPVRISKNEDAAEEAASKNSVVGGNNNDKAIAASPAIKMKEKEVQHAHKTAPTAVNATARTGLDTGRTADSPKLPADNRTSYGSPLSGTLDEKGRNAGAITPDPVKGITTETPAADKMTGAGAVVSNTDKKNDNVKKKLLERVKGKTIRKKVADKTETTQETVKNDSHTITSEDGNNNSSSSIGNDGVPTDNIAHVEDVTHDMIDLIASSITDLADENGWAFLGDVGTLIAKKKPDFDPRNYGFVKLTPLIRSLEVFELDIRETSQYHIKHVYVRNMERV